MNYVITGRPISKKNSKRIFRRGGKTINRPIIVPSEAYKKFEFDAIIQLKKQHGNRRPFTEWLSVNYSFYIKGKYRVDVDNLIAGVNDVLEKAKVIENDRLITSGTYEMIRGSEDWYTEVNITNLPVKKGGEK